MQPDISSADYDAQLLRYTLENMPPRARMIVETTVEACTAELLRQLKSDEPAYMMAPAVAFAISIKLHVALVDWNARRKERLGS